MSSNQGEDHGEDQGNEESPLDQLRGFLHHPESATRSAADAASYRYDQQTGEAAGGDAATASGAEQESSRHTTRAQPRNPVVDQ